MSFENELNHQIENMNLFEVVYKRDRFELGGKEYPIGYTSLLAIQPDCRFMDESAFSELSVFGDSLIENMTQDHLTEYSRRIIAAIKSLKEISFFSLFDLDRYINQISFLLSEDRILQYIEIDRLLRNGFDLSTPEKADRADMLIQLSDDFFTVLVIGRILKKSIRELKRYAALVFQMTHRIAERGARTKSQLADAFGIFLSDPYMSSIFHTDQQPLCTNAAITPVVENVNGENHIYRKVRYSNLKDFLYTDLVGGYRHGHYLWQCGICDDYFFMTTAHKQLYCSTVNPKYGVPCAYVAKHPEVLHRKPEQQKKTDSQYYQLWKRRNDLIRKNKSLGKYDDAVSANAKRYIDSCFELAQVDFEYAFTQYVKDMEMTNVYRKAMEMLNV